jgi:hypothetical protein
MTFVRTKYEVSERKKGDQESHLCDIVNLLKISTELYQNRKNKDVRNPHAREDQEKNSETVF